MEYKRFGKTVVVRMDPGEEILEQMALAAKAEHVKCASVSAIGAVNDFTVGLYDVAEKKYFPNRFTGAYEIVSLLGNIRDTTVAHGRATVVEVMGRHCGDLALSAGLAAGAESILIPEVPYDLDAICEKMEAGKKRGKHHSIIMKAEGVDIETRRLAEILEERTGIETRSVVPAYIQRGGTPTAGDRTLAGRLGYRAVELLRDNAQGVAVGVRGEELIVENLEEAAHSENRVDSRIIELAAILSI